jgi:hypothetical protein
MHRDIAWMCKPLYECLLSLWSVGRAQNAGHRLVIAVYGWFILRGAWMSRRCLHIRPHWPTRHLRRRMRSRYKHTGFYIALSNFSFRFGYPFLWMEWADWWGALHVEIFSFFHTMIYFLQEAEEGEELRKVCVRWSFCFVTQFQQPECCCWLCVTEVDGKCALLWILLTF